MTSAVGAIQVPLPSPPPRPSTVASAAFGSALERARGATEPRTVAAQRTPLTGEGAAEALEAAWTEVTGERPSRETVAVLSAQWAHETGRGRSMFNFNFGGMKGTSPEGLTVSQRTREGHGATERRIVDRFRAYQTAESGATDYVQLLARRYSGAMDAARRGDATGFVQSLKAGGYFTGDERAYTRSVASLAQHALDHGFGALGADSNAPPIHYLDSAAPNAAVSAPAVGARRPVSEEPTRLEWSGFFGGAAEGPSFTMADTLAMTDALSRAALRIAGNGRDE